MIILPYFLFIFFSGFALAAFLPGKTLLMKAALSPALGIFLPSFLVYLLNFLNIPLLPLTLTLLWFPSGLVFIFWKRRDLGLFFKKALAYYEGENIWMKRALPLMAFGLIGLIARGTVNPMWDGDGWLHWAPKAVEWTQNARLIYNPELEGQLRLWVSYPLYHSIGMMINIMILPFPPAYSIKVFDVLYIGGLMLAAAAILQKLGRSPRQIIGGSLLCVWAQKDLLSFVLSGYAELDMAYYYFLGTAIFLFSWMPFPSQDNDFWNDLISGFLLGIMVITKNEGAYRLGILLLLLPFFRQGTLFSRAMMKKAAVFLSPILALKLLDQVNAPVRYFVDYYYERTDVTLEYLWAKLPLIIMAGLQCFNPSGPFKSFWIIAFFLAALTLYESGKENWEEKKFLGVLAALFVLNAGFDHIPSWIADPNTDYRALAREVIGRIHLHSSTFLSLLGVIGVQHYFDKGKGLIPRNLRLFNNSRLRS